MTEAELSLGSHRRPYWRPGYYLFVFVLVLADLLSKDWAWQFSNRLEPQQVFGDWLSWETLTNPGGVFGLWRGLTLPLTIVRIFAVGLLFWLLGRQARANWKGSATLSLLLAGAIGNLYDNLSAWMPWEGNGEVRDFIRVDLGVQPDWWPDVLPWLFHPWPIFNLADSYISIAFIILIAGLAAVELQAPKPKEAP